MATFEIRYSTPFQSFLDTSFFQELSRLKLDILKLDTSGQPLYACLDLTNSTRTNKSIPLYLNRLSFDETAPQSVSGVPILGMIYNFNVFDEFKNLDKIAFIEKRAVELYESGKIDINKSIGFFIISFADLKKYKYYYWVCVPSFQKVSLNIVGLKRDQIQDSKRFQEWFDENTDQWVAILDHNENIVEYSISALQTIKALIIRDSSRLDDTPSSLTKNILSIFKYDSPETSIIDVLFIRPNNSSFLFKLEIKEALNRGDSYRVSGWERNSQGKLGPRAIDLSSLIDPLKVADQSVDLNLKLMKWRIVPDINLDVIKNVKVLLLGSGTLGCYVSRTLMAWGVRKITLVDNGSVSYSNPVRQPLFQFEDVGKPKSVAAAESLRKVFPLMDVEGIQLSVPMIGHPVTNEEGEHKDYERLCQLYAEHDAVFLLMDSRETRWLPSVLGNVQNKIVINAALGFDSYLVMRHGNEQNKHEKNLGCYFCNDVYAPKDSLTDRTLDEMCTVTRPGVALMAASQAVEMFVSILQAKDNTVNVLGEIPHQIRGFLRNFSVLKLETPAYQHCSACSAPVITACKEKGWEFVRSALNDYTYIEKISGLNLIQQEADKAIHEWGTDEDEDEFIG